MDIKQEIEDFDFGANEMHDLLGLIIKIKTKEDATRILERYREFEPEYANKNLGYMFGYYNEETRKRIYALFPVNHPVFGSGFGRGKDPTFKEAFEKGKNIIKSE